MIGIFLDTMGSVPAILTVSCEVCAGCTSSLPPNIAKYLGPTNERDEKNR